MQRIELARVRGEHPGIGGTGGIELATAVMLEALRYEARMPGAGVGRGG
jgi:hypothetical protein